MIRVVVADDHTVVREGIRRILERCSDIRVVAEATHSIISGQSRSRAISLVLPAECRYRVWTGCTTPLGG